MSSSSQLSSLLHTVYKRREEAGKVTGARREDARDKADKKAWGKQRRPIIMVGMELITIFTGKNKKM